MSMDYQTKEYIPPHKKVTMEGGYSRTHLINLMIELDANYTNKYGNTKCYGEGYIRSLDEITLRGMITSYFVDSQIDSANKSVTARYAQGKKRGRPFGSKNKAKSNEGSSYDALKALGIEGDSDENNDIQTETKVEDKSNASTAALEAMFNRFIEVYGKDIADLRYTVRSEIARLEEKIEANKVTVVKLETKELGTIDMGVQHKNFPLLLAYCNAALRNGSHLNVWLHGPAGTGKSTAAEKVAEALNLAFYTDGKLADEVKVTGYQDGGGRYLTTNFRQAFEFGGVYLGDEIDGSMPDALLALNGALANSRMAFPDKIVTRHKDFIFIAAANTTGTGGTIEYVGRFQQDAAFNDRFVFLDWPLDETLEDSLVANKEWLARVRHVRKRLAANSGIKGHLVTPRASIYGESLLAAGLPMHAVEKAVLRKGLTDTQWNLIN